MDAHTQALLPETLIPVDRVLGYDDQKPVFFRHYWMAGEPKPLRPRVACVDYRAGK